jgi:16S rRNA pseudouridine516 synthase
MHSKRARLDRFISSKTGIGRRDVRLLLAQGRICVDGQPATAINQGVDEFSKVSLDEQVLQASLAPVYLMLHKPAGVVSATRDDHHKTAIDLLQHPQRSELHIAGRLDFNSTGLLLLTNDGRWSRRISEPGGITYKHYLVTLEHAIDPDCVEAFATGMWFAYEGISTRPARLEIIDTCVARVSLVEGRYHQIKRMFGHFHNRVLALHRYAIGQLQLDTALLPGQSRALTPAELASLEQIDTPQSPQLGAG